MEQPRRWVMALLVGAALALSTTSDIHSCAIDGATAYQPQFAEIAWAMGWAACGLGGGTLPELPALEVGYPESHLQAARIPGILLRAIGYVESSWHQATYSVPRGSSGPALVSYSCGYGIMQITSGMRYPGELPLETQQRIASQYRYNIGWGARILAEKWNYAPDPVPAIGDRDPAIVENWYYAVWAYNYWGWLNNPNNPDFPWSRAPFDGSQSRTNYPYQELVFGYAAHPPLGDGQPLWQPMALTLPAPEAVGLTPRWFATPAPSHQDPCRLHSALLPVVLKDFRWHPTHWLLEEP